MKRAGIISIGVIISLFLINGIFSISISDITKSIGLTYPQEATQGEEFEVSLVLNDFSEDIYDVKIDILNQDERISKIWNGDSWQSTFNYVNDIINTSDGNSESFRLNITSSFNGTADIEVRIRDSSGASDLFEGYQINVISSSQDNNTNDTTQNDTEPEISLEMEWDKDDIVNGEEFNIEFRVKNLKDKDYDVRAWIEDDGKIISERYDEDNEEWKSGQYYITEFFKGPGNKSDNIKLRIKSSSRDFEGNAEIFFKIRDEKEIEDEIKIKAEKKKTTNTNPTPAPAVTKTTPKETSPITAEVIRLGKSNVVENSEDNTNTTQKYLVYESKIELVKKYSVFGFAFLLVIFCILLVSRRLD